MPSAMPAWVIDPVSRMPSSRRIFSWADRPLVAKIYAQSQSRRRHLGRLPSRFVLRSLLRNRIWALVDDFALELVAGAELHRVLLRCCGRSIHRMDITIPAGKGDLAAVRRAHADRRAGDRGRHPQANLRWPRARSPTPARPR